ncbi:MAG TPA: alpha/beta hydrolase-fold protein, partial [Bryobacteraceae bacterium]|nr:alpha/beta hydrolase-fold protein [Bryobacteraceae bacterium]
YLQDGQNLFDSSTAFGGQEWYVDETADHLIRNGAVEPLIIVGIYNAGVHRIDEYTPSRDRHMRAGGKGHLYGRMLVEEIRPFIEAEYRVATGPQHTALGGSSLGALVSLVLGLRYRRIFGKLAILSPSVWWDNRLVLNLVEDFDVRTRPRIWLDIGTNEGSHPAQITEDARTLRDLLLRKGWQLGVDLCYFEAVGAEHNEQAWSQRVGPMLRFLFPPNGHVTSRADQCLPGRVTERTVDLST